MATYLVTDPRSGKKLKLTGDSPPTEQELDGIFASQTGTSGIDWDKYTSKPKKKEAGFFSTLYEQATTLGLADEAAAFVANPTEENQKAFIEAGNSKYESAGGFDPENIISLRNWRALKETVGGSLGALVAPVAAATAATLTTGLGGTAAGLATAGAQYDIQYLLRQAQERQKAADEGRVPEEVSPIKATGAALASTALDYGGGKLVFKTLFAAFPVLRNLFGEADEVVVKETGKLLEDAFAKGAYNITKTGVTIGAVKGAGFEIPQEIFQSLAERWNAGLSLTDKDAQEEYKQAAIGAGLLGAPMGAANAALRQRATKAAAEKKLADETASATKTKTEAVGNISAQGDITEQRGLFDEPAVVPVEEETEEEIFAQNDDDAPADIPPPAATTTPAATPAEYTPSYDSFKGIPGVTHLFRTGRGSVYAQNDKNQTIRDRSGKGHKDATTGLQPSSGKTIYLTSGAINRLGSLLQDNRATQLMPTVDKSGNPIAQVVLMEDYGTGKKLQKKGSILAAAPYTLIPQVGLNPVEIYDSISPANQAAPGIHFGNKITEVLEVPQTPAATPATTATPVEAPPPVTTATPAAEPTPTPAVDENGQMQLGLVQAEPVTEGDKAKLATTEFEQKYRQLIAPDTQEVSPLPAIITEAMLDALDIPKEAPIRKRVINEDLNNPTIRAMLLTYANNEAVKAGDNDSSVRVKRALNIQRMGTNANQMELDLRRPEKPKDDTLSKAAEERYKKAQVIKDGDSLLTAIAKLGGLSPEAAIAEADFDIPDLKLRTGFNQSVVKRGGNDLDGLARALAERGFPTVNEQGKPDPNVLMDLIQQELNPLGRKVYSAKGAEEKSAQDAEDYYYGDEPQFANVPTAEETEFDNQGLAQSEELDARREELNNDAARYVPFDSAETAPTPTPVTPATPERITVDGVSRSRVNNKGQAIASTDEGLISFWRWFGDSVVVDSKGNPIVMYHGTDAEFSIFDVKATKKNRGTNFEGVYTTPDKLEAETFGKNVLGLYVKSANPYSTGKSPVTKEMAAKYAKVLNFYPGYKDDSIGFIISYFKKSGVFKDIDGALKTDVLKAGGYDSYIDGPHVVVFSSDQVKPVSSEATRIEPKRVKTISKETAKKVLESIVGNNKGSNLISDLVDKNPLLRKLSQDYLRNKHGDTITVYRSLGLTGDLRTEKIVSTTDDANVAINMNNDIPDLITKNDFISPKRSLLRYDIPIENVRAYVPYLLDISSDVIKNLNQKTVVDRKTGRKILIEEILHAGQKESEVVADLSGISPSQVLDMGTGRVIDAKKFEIIRSIKSGTFNPSNIKESSEWVEPSGFSSTTRTKQEVEDLKNFGKDAERFLSGSSDKKSGTRDSISTKESSKATRIEPEGVGRANDTPSKLVRRSERPKSDDTGRPPSKYPVQPAEGETIVANPELVPKSQLDRVRIIVNGDRDTAQEKLRITGDLTPIEIVEYDITQNKAGDTIHRVQYSDGGVTVVAFDKNSQNSGMDFNREYIPPVPPKEASKPLTVKAVEDIDAPLPKSVVTALNAGDLAGALKALGATGKNKSIGFMARALLRAVGGTKVEVVVGLVDESGNPVAGLFDPITNTIKLDSKTGINSHAVLHEMTHAAVSAVLANPSHPVTRQLTVLFNAVKDKLGTAYGAQNLDEFVAEAFTNKVFQQKLAMLLQPNEKISVWGKFVNTISNFVRNLLGLPSRQQDIKTMDELHTAILSIMAPAPKSRFAGELYMAQAVRDASKLVDVEVAKVPPVNSLPVRSFFGVVLDKGERAAKELVMSLTPLIPLEQIAKKYIPMATQISKTILEQDGYAKRIHAILSDTAAAITKWAGNNQTKYKEFSDLVNTSTREEVDARLTDKDAEKKYKNDTDKKNLWAALRYEYLNKLDDVGRKLYGDTFDAYKEIRNEHFSVLKNKIQETAGVDANQADILAKNLEAKLMALGYIDPYAKLGRPDGKYFLTFNAVDPATGKKELYFEIFTSEFVREKRLAELVADKKNVDQASIARTTRGDNTNYRNRAPDTSFIKSVLKVLEDNKVNKEVEDDILALFLDSMPEKSYLKGLTQARTGTLGYVDVVSTLKQQAFASATHLSRLKYNTEFRRLKAELLKYAATARYSPDADTIGLYAGKLKEHIDFALNPSVEDWAKIASAIGFNFGLGFNVSGFFINLSAFGTLIHPYLAGKYAVGGTNYKKAWGDTTKAMGVGFSVFRNSGSFAAPDVNKYRVGLEHYDFSRADIPPGVKMFFALQNRMKELGQFSRVEVEDELHLGAYGNALGGNLAKLNRASGWFMSQSERILRQTTTIATYQLELAKQLKIPVSGLAAAFAAGKITPEMQLAAADEAVLVTELVNSGAMAQTAAEFSKTGFGKVASLFRRYSLNTFSILLKLSQDSIYGTAEDKKIARQQLAGIFGNTAIIAGVGGVPFFGSLALLYDLLFADDDEDDFETLTRKMVGEKVYGGLASYLLGSSVSSRIGFSDFIFRETYADKDSPYLWRLMLQVGGPLVGMASQLETGAKLIGRGEIRRGMEAAAPSFARNLLKAQRFYAEGPQTIAGDQIAPPIDIREAIMQGLGFPPSDYIQLLEQNAASSKMDRYASKLRSEIYTRYYRARKEHDVEALARIREEIKEYKVKFPKYPIRQQDLQASYKRRDRISKEKIAGLTVNRNLESQIQEERDEWDEASSIWDDLFEAEEDTEE